VFFTGPIWLSILIPIVFAPVLLIASLAIRPGRGARRDKSAFLSAAGLALALLTGGAVLAAVLVGFVLFTHWIALRLERAASRRNRGATHSRVSSRAWLVVAVAVHLTTVAAIVRASLIAGPRQGVGATLVPFGVSYFAFHGISYVIDVYRGRVVGNRSRCQLAVYLMLLPMIVSGPLSYRAVASHLAQGWPSLSDYSYGVRRLVIGAWKVFVVADVAGRQADTAFALRPSHLSALLAWVGLVSFTLQIYYGFSGYSDMGIGFGRMLGLRLPENFRWPYVGQTVGEFWRRWHLGLSTWLRDYVVRSPDDDRVAPPSVSREALVVLLCGLWYGAGWTFAAWGLYHAGLIAWEQSGVDVEVKRLPILLRHVYLILVVMVGWVVFRSQTLEGGLLYLKALAGLNLSPLPAGPTIEPAVWVVLAAGAIGCAPLSQAIRRWTVTIDALILSLLMLVSAPVLFAWRCGSNIGTPVLRWWRASRSHVGRPGGSAS
jgi:D-alanyl-lipoteichoic acid acyltransferase DltB (MBOAT superfamily)